MMTFTQNGTTYTVNHITGEVMTLASSNAAAAKSLNVVRRG